MLVFNHKAVTDQKTVVNLTRHEYFNLSKDKNIIGHQLMIDADEYLPKTDDGIPTGELKPVEKTVMDFQKMAVLCDKLAKKEDGFDHNYVLNKRDEKEPAAVLLSPNGSIKLNLFCTRPGLQFFSAADIGQ